MKNLNFSKKRQNKHPLNGLNTLFKKVFPFCKFQLSQNIKGIFFSPIGFVKQKQIDWNFFTLFFFLYFSISSNLKVKKIVYTFCSTLRNLEVNKNPRKNRFRNVCLSGLNELFSTPKTEKLRFLEFFNGRFIYFEKVNNRIW